MGDNVGFLLNETNFNHRYGGSGYQRNDGIIEPPSLRNDAWSRGVGRHPWNQRFEDALEEMRTNESTSRFMDLLENEMGMGNDTLPHEQMWVDLREPVAGELVIPRALRSGFRVHINPCPFEPSGRQLRVSSNFFSLRGVKNFGDLSNFECTKIIAAFLLSSFGQIQFESYCNPREGMMRISKAGALSRIRVPRLELIPDNLIQQILNEYEKLPFPIPRNNIPEDNEYRRHLDILFAEVILKNTAIDYTVDDLEKLVKSVHRELFEWLGWSE